MMVQVTHLTTLETTGRPVEYGTMVCVSQVLAVNVFKDLREILTNVVGGNMRRYEALLEHALKEVRRQFEEKLREEGYDGALGVRIAHPQIVGGGAELVMYGTGFRWVEINSNDNSNNY